MYPTCALGQKLRLVIVLRRSEDLGMGELSGILSRIDELELLIIKLAEIVGITLVCLIGIKTHFRKLRQKSERRKKSKTGSLK